MSISIKKQSIVSILTANFLYKLFSVILPIIFVPYFLNFLGIESYGLIGYYYTLTTIFVLLDLGIGTFIAKELAQKKALNCSIVSISNFVRSFEVYYWSISFAILLLFFIASHFVTTTWIHSEGYDLQRINTILKLMGITFFFQFPLTIYCAIYMGLNRQVMLNGILLVVALIRNIGYCLILKFSIAIESYFIWQSCINCILVVILFIFLLKKLPLNNIQISLKYVKESKKNLSQLAGFTLAAIILGQIDKLIISNVVSLQLFGYYCIAGALAQGLQMIASAFFATFLPNFSEDIALKNQIKLIETYHISCRYLAAVAIPIGLCLIFFSKELLFLWTGDLTITQNSYQFTSLLSLGALLNSLMMIPASMQIAYGRTKPLLIQNVIAIIVLAPLIYCSAKYVDVTFAAGASVLLNLSYLVINIHYMHKSILQTEKRKWYIHDVARPAFFCLIYFYIARAAITFTENQLVIVLIMAATMALAFLVAFFSIQGNLTQGNKWSRLIYRLLQSLFQRIRGRNF